MSDIISRYFAALTPEQHEQYRALGSLYPEWNAKINVISRKDIDNLYERHVLHSLAIAAFLGSVAPGTTFMDMGSGGGFPGIPLAIMYPQCSFHLVDRIAKKLRVAQAVADAIGLRNVTVQHGDIGECHDRYNYVVSRAVMPLDGLARLVRKNVARQSIAANRYANGLIALKGGDLEEETGSITTPVLEYPIGEFFAEEFFTTKKVVYMPM
ncbi:MAG: 16S rRNA (guanine(527)-N(7))-methyltransferase RsmG [Muribaculaceae bacterium]